MTKQTEAMRTAFEADCASNPVYMRSESEAWPLYQRAWQAALGCQTVSGCGCYDDGPGGIVYRCRKHRDPNQTVPEGYMLVPIEPTVDMLNASGIKHILALNVWDDMLTAASRVDSE